MIRSAACVFFGILALLSQRRLFKYLKSRHNNVQLGVLNNVVRSRCRLNSLLFHVRFLELCRQICSSQVHSTTCQKGESLPFRGNRTGVREG